MQAPPEISFHNLESSTWAEQEIRAGIADLERLYDRLVTCRVHVDQRADNSNHTVPRSCISRWAFPARRISW
jgi:hypothetical protein